nr:hypothetical protein [uncultured Undibacterium sp.]
MNKNSLKLCVLILMLIFGLTDFSTAVAQQRNFDTGKKLEMRQKRIEEFRAVRQIERQERFEREVRQNGKLQSPIQSNNKASLPTSRPAQELGERPILKFNRLTPEERLALRRQIREAREDIYQKRQEKN